MTHELCLDVHSVTLGGGGKSRFQVEGGGLFLGRGRGWGVESETFQGGQSISRVANYISYPHLKKRKTDKKEQLLLQLWKVSQRRLFLLNLKKKYAGKKKKTSKK